MPKKTIVVEDDDYDSDTFGHFVEVPPGERKRHNQQQYLKKYRETLGGDQIEKYEQIRKAHMTFRLNGFESPQGLLFISRLEGFLREVYQA